MGSIAKLNILNNFKNNKGILSILSRLFLKITQNSNSQTEIQSREIHLYLFAKEHFSMAWICSKSESIAPWICKMPNWTANTL
ncbi:unnamed protein product [Blepharisma stoltei]|uniref:Uncharacterized protein n=1 Tax=Blepharisma stoltei TaxID=1481888 RepID=A0AAU9K5H1_9CILI|nr:unnamed protein product [Blepharisma stoltei]